MLEELKKYAQISNVIGSDYAHAERAVKALEWIASTPEGMTQLQKLYELHNRPIDILVDENAIQSGYIGLEGMHAISLNPKQIENTHFIGIQGEKIRGTLERGLAHELAHGTQPGAPEAARAMSQRQQELVNALFPTLPPDAIQSYIHRLKSANGDIKAIENIFGEIYDTYILPRKAELDAALQQRIKEDPIAKAYAEQYETGAIEFENLIMKHKGEPARTTDYYYSGVSSNIGNSARDAFIGAQTQMFLYSKAEKERVTKTEPSDTRSGRDPSEIRPDAPPKPSDNEANIE